MTTKETPNKITAVLKVTATAEFFGDEASEETLRYCIEQDLEDAGFDVDVSLLKEQEAVLAHWDDDTGHWIEGDRNGIDTHARTTGEMIDTFRCSWCGFYQYWKTPFCPNCGAKMEGR